MVHGLSIVDNRMRHSSSRLQLTLHIARRHFLKRQHDEQNENANSKRRRLADIASSLKAHAPTQIMDLPPIALSLIMSKAGIWQIDAIESKSKNQKRKGKGKRAKNSAAQRMARRIPLGGGCVALPEAEIIDIEENKKMTVSGANICKAFKDALSLHPDLHAESAVTTFGLEAAIELCVLKDKPEILRNILRVHDEDISRFKSHWNPQNDRFIHPRYKGTPWTH